MKHALTAVNLLVMSMLSVCLGAGPSRILSVEDRAAESQYANWISLFDGKTLAGWKASESLNTFTVVKGSIVAKGARSHLFYVGDGISEVDYKNFELEIEVMTKPGANSGVYFHTAFQPEGWPGQGFEVQVNNSQKEHDGYLEMKKTGSLYGIRNVYKAMARDNQWFQMRIRVDGRRVQIWLDRTLLVDYIEPDYPANSRYRRLGHGTFALQGHDPGSEVHFRNIRVRRLPDKAPKPVIEPEPFDEVARQLLELSGNNFPLVDLHCHLKGGLTLDEVLAHMRRTGINYGIAINGGIGFPITDDEGIEQFRKSMEGKPCFIALQAEGREWPTLFSKEAIAKFDYVFTDGMTIPWKGKRTRLWIKEEVEIDDPQAFMEHLVDTIVKILDNEPIDIYVNPTFIPSVIAADYDKLWTPERMDRVIAAAAKRKIAIEINNRYEIPSIEFIKRAKAAGIKFTLGTNNVDPNLGRMEYGLRVIKECGLSWKDMWMPEQKH